jgi:hypothetical protein
VSRETLTGSYGDLSSAVRGLQGPYRRVGRISGSPEHPAASIALPHTFSSHWGTSRRKMGTEWPLAEPVSLQHTGEARFNDVARMLRPFREV